MSQTISPHRGVSLVRYRPNSDGALWRRQLVGTWARAPPPWRLREFFFARLYVETSCLVWFGTMQNSNSALFVQPYLLLNDAITGYNRVGAKIDFTA